MKNRYKYPLLGSVVILALMGIRVATAQEQTSFWDQSIWESPDRGFQWYPPDKPAQPAKPRPKPIEKITDAAEFEAELKRLRGVAVMNPTQENVVAYYRAQRMAMDHASAFAVASRQAIWQHPEIDENVRSPMNNAAFNVSEQMNADLIRKQVAAVSKDFGLVFFFRSDCRYCHATAPALLQMRRKHGIEVMAISMDGGPMPGFPDAKPDNGISSVISNGEGVNYYPSIYLVSKDTKESVLLGAGALTAEDIGQRIVYLTRGGDSFTEARMKNVVRQPTGR